MFNIVRADASPRFRFAHTTTHKYKTAITWMIHLITNILLIGKYFYNSILSCRIHFTHKYDCAATTVERTILRISACMMPFVTKLKNAEITWHGGTVARSVIKRTTTYLFHSTTHLDFSRKSGNRRCCTRGPRFCGIVHSPAVTLQLEVPFCHATVGMS